MTDPRPPRPSQRSDESGRLGRSGASGRLERPGESAGETTSGRLKRSELQAMLSRADASRSGTRQAGAARDTRSEGDAGVADPLHLVGKTLGPCKIIELIGEGGLGRVYRARHLRLEHDVAVKVVGGARTTRPEALARFRREATIAARLNHPHVARVLDTNEQDGIHYIIQELVPGTSLEDRVQAKGPLSLEEVRIVGAGLASGLDSIHKAGVVHRDLKPANVLIVPDGQPKLLDFGIAKDLEGEAGFTDDKAMLGTPTFLAPEQVNGQDKVGPAADIYGLGGTLFFALTGRAPLEPQEDDTLLRYLNRRTKQPAPDVRTLRKDTPAPLATLIARLLAIAPSDRPSASEAYDVLHTLDVRGRPPATPPRANPSSGRHRVPPPRKGPSERVAIPAEPAAKQPPAPAAPARTGGIQGSLEDMSLLELLQGVEFNAKTGHVELDGGGVKGVIEFQEGSPWDARTDDGATGEAAIRKLLSVTSGSFALRSESPRDGTRRVKVSFTRLMLDASRVSDESGRHDAIPDDPGPPPPAGPDDDPDTSELPVAAKLKSTDEVKNAIAALEARALPDPVGDPFLGCTVGLFEVEKLVGLEAGERQYLALDTGNDARCLLRVFPFFGPHEAEFRRLAKRADAALRVDHPNLERCLGSGRTRDAFFAAFEPPIGLSVAELVKRDGPQPPERVLQVIEDVARGLKALHRRNQSHGAVSAETVRLDPGGAAILCDAGLSRPHPAFAFLGDGELLGSPGFAAPEALDQGLVGPAADLYALGCVAWTLLAGAPPVDPSAPSLELLERAHAPLPPVPGRSRPPAGLATLLEKLSAVDPRRRYGNVNDLLADVRAARQGDAIQPFPPPPQLQARARRGLLQRNPRLVSLVFGSLALALAVALVGVIAWSRSLPLGDPFEGYRFTLDGK